MRIASEDYSYAGYIAAAETYLERMSRSGFLIPEAKTLWVDYRTHADPIQGKPQPHMEFHPVNFRGGYEKNVPGNLGEIITGGMIRKLLPNVEIIYPQDKLTQVTLKIDVVTKDPDLVSVQSKVIRFTGSSVIITPEYFAGSATHVSLTDIDDRETFIINRVKLKQLATDNKWSVKKKDLKEHGVFLDAAKYYGLSSITV